MFPVEVSNRHLHLCKEDYEKLFDKPLTKLRELSQKGEFAAEQTVVVGCFDKIRIVGPFRPESQLEMSATDAKQLDLKLPLRLSGDLYGAPMIEVTGAIGKVKVPAILAKRHFHCTTEDAKKLRLVNHQKIDAKVNETTFYGVVVRIGFGVSVLHLDKDEAMLAKVVKGDKFEIVT